MIALALGRLLLGAAPAAALEALDGRVQAHGFGEMQVRTLSEKYGLNDNEFDLAQWYNVINVEFELDIIRDKLGPIDLMSTFVRVEGRYDCIYTYGCSMFKSVNTYGDNHKKLPQNLRDAEDPDYAGVNKVGTPKNRIPNKSSAPLGGYREAEPFGKLRIDPNGPIEVDGVRYSPNNHRPDWRYPLKEKSGAPVLDKWGNPKPVRNDSITGILVPNPDFDPTVPPPPPPSNAALFAEKKFLVPPLGCDPARGCPGVPGGTVYELDSDGKFVRDLNGVPIPKTENGVPVYEEPSLVVALNGDDVNPVYVDAIIPRLGFPGFDTFNDLTGGDLIPNTIDDPAVYVMGEFSDYRFGLKKTRGPAGGAGTTQIIGPWLPKNTINSQAVLRDKANPFRGALAQSLYTATGRTPNRRYYTRSQDLVALQDPNDLAKNYAQRSLLWVDPGDGISIPGDASAGFTDLVDPFPAELDGLWDDDYYLTAPFDNRIPGSQPSENPNQKFGGDYNGIIPCVVPRRERVGGTSTFQNQIQGSEKQAGCIPFTNVRVTGGKGELPFRPAPDRSNLFARYDPMIAQGLYIPSPGLLSYLKNGGDFDPHDFNISDWERSWNRGASQEDNKELKEAYVDIEVLDSRLWMRLGLQNIVWGKTELFRTTDQLNPTDIGLAGPLAGLEESRIALWSARFVYSLYDVGPLEDVRLELAVNLDDFEPIDLGACGEPFTLNVVCSITTGLFAHGLLGVGIAGVDRPPSFWNDISGLEGGARIEWRWDRFSFALTDFYGYEDLPFPDTIRYFDRDVEFDLGILGDPAITHGMGAGRPLAAGFSTGCSGKWGGSGRPGAAGIDTWASADRDPHSYRSMTQAGIGRDPACLKPGGAAGQLNQNGFTVARDADGNVTFVQTDPLGNPVPGPGSTVFSDGKYTYVTKLVTIPCDPSTFSDATNFCEPQRYEVGLTDTSYNGQLFAGGWSPQNALENHTANQQFFAFACTATLTIGAQLDPSSCAFNLFASPTQIATIGTADFPPFAEVIACIMAGETGFACQGYMNLIAKNVSGVATPPIRESAIVPMNRDWNDGLITATNAAINRDTILALLPPLDQQLLALLRFTPGPEDMLTLDSTLTNEQRALLGCGPFYGTRCDTSVRAKTTTIFGLQANTCGLVGIGCKEGGGLDFLNMEAKILMQSWVGIEGTELDNPAYTSDPEYAQWAKGGSNFVGTPWEGDGIWLTTSGLPQPGTIEFAGGPTCTRYDPASRSTVVLPGCRGVNKVINRDTAKTTEGYIAFQFDDGYDPAVDGCVLGATIDGLPVKGFYADKTPVDLSLCNQSTHKIGGFYVWDAGSTDASHPQQSLPKLVDWGGTPTEMAQTRMSRPGAGTLWHPYAGCFVNPEAAVGTNPCIQVPKSDVDLVKTLPQYAALKLRLAQGNGTKIKAPDGQVQEQPRDFEGDFFKTDINVQSQIFSNELAAFSWNFMQFLVQASCDGSVDDVENDPECFDPRQQFVVGKCSYATPQFCTNVKGFFGAAGVGRNTIRAGGNGKYGRRNFIWHSGGELVLKYQQRNVLGFSMDFGEDTTKSNWGVEFTWVNEQNFVNHDDYQDNVTKSDVLNLTISADRPTFINFMNQNRTFFLNTQWFFQYIVNYEKGFTTPGPLNVLFTVAMFTGYFQDRLNPLLVAVYDFRSGSGGLLPSVTYRFTEALSVGIGMNFFWGHTQLVDMPLRAWGPTENRTGKDAYMDGQDNVIANLRDKDEIWLKLRWTF